MDSTSQATITGGTLMNYTQLDHYLTAARKGHGNRGFVTKTMSQINQSETFFRVLRTTKDKQLNGAHTMNKRHLSAFALMAIIAGVVLVLSGSTYAAYKLLWPKPDVHISQPTTSVSGRQEVAISFAQCGDENIASRYELKKSATITIDEVPQVVKAHCELDAITTWANSAFPHDNELSSPLSTTEHDSTRLSTSMATHIKSQDNSSMTFVGLTKYNQTDTTFPLTSATRFIADGRDVSASTLTSADPVMYITSDTIHTVPIGDCTPEHCNTSGTITASKLVAVVKLSLPFQYYDQYAWQSLAERTTCQGNSNDSCLSGFVGSIDLYVGNARISDNSLQMKEIQGVVTQLSGTTTTIRSSSGTLFTISTPTDVVATYNTKKASLYNNQLVKLGSSLMVRYIEKTDQHSKALVASSLLSVELQIEMVGKSDPTTAY